MTEQYRTLIEFENLFPRMINLMLGWDYRDKKVRVAYSQTGAPAWGVEDNLVFLYAKEVDNLYNRPREVTDIYEVSPDEFSSETNYTRVMQLFLTLYGTNATTNADTIRDSIFYPEFKLLLDQQKVYLIHDIAAPRRAPEYWEGLWYERVDMSMTFNELIVRSISVPRITSIDVAIYEGEGGTKIAEIHEEE
jgi:hypothetical protein